MQFVFQINGVVAWIKLFYNDTLWQMRPGIHFPCFLSIGDRAPFLAHKESNIRAVFTCQTSEAWAEMRREKSKARVIFVQE